MPISMTAADAIVPAVVQQRRWWLVLLALWAAGAWILLEAHVEDIRVQSVQIATESARNMFRMVVLTRSWNASHGGIYVPVTPKTQPNPYLPIARRDVTTNDGQSLTLINPAYMTRLIAEMAESDSGAIFRLTSLRPVRPENAADPWEKKSLEAFESGILEVVSIEPDAHGRQLRYMAPLKVEQSCMACHARQGYQIGTIRGGISVSQHFGPIEAAITASINQTQLSYVAVFGITAMLGWLLLELLRKRWFELAGNIQELKTTRSELVQSEKMASLGRMVAGFAHELNTPVGVAVGAVSHNTETLLRIDRMLSVEEVNEDLLRHELAGLRESGDLALANLRRAASLVQSFKRTSVDQTSEQFRTFNVKELISDVLFSMQSTLKKLPIQVAVQCPEKLELHGMPGLVQQLLTNLVMNAVQHAFDAGKRPGTVVIKVTHNAPNVRLEFSDDGKGMDANQLARIFEPFYTTRRDEGGSGLGLYICYNIVTTQLGGTIVCHSQPETGCQFDIQFSARLNAKIEEGTA